MQAAEQAILENIASTFETVEDLTLDTLLGELAKSYVEEVQATPDVWEKLSLEAKQDIKDRCKNKAEDMIKKITYLIANRGFPSCIASLDGVNFKKGAKITMSTANDQSAHDLAQRINLKVLILNINYLSRILKGQPFIIVQCRQKDISGAHCHVGMREMREDRALEVGVSG